MSRCHVIEAVTNSDRESLRHRLDAGDNPDQRDASGKTALMHAAERGDAEMVSCLLDCGASIRLARFPPEGGTPIEFAIGGGHAHIVALLITHGATIARFLPVYAARLGHLEILNLLLDRGSALTASYDGSTALHALCAFGPNHARPLSAEAQRRTANRLLDAGADPNAMDALRETPLLAAVRAGNAPMIELLLARGADPNLPENSSLLATAPTSPIVERLLQAGISSTSRHTAFRLFLKQNRHDLARLIAQSLPASERDPLVHGLDVVDAIRRADAASVHRLISHGSPGDVPDPFAGMALVEAGRLHPVPCRHAMTRLLLKAGFNPNQLACTTTPLIAAIALKDLELVIELLESGANPNVHFEGGDSALMAAVGSHDGDNERLPPASRFDPAVDALCRVLLASGADVNARGFGGRTALAYAVLRSPFNLDLLIEAGADVNLGTFDGWTPLMLACDEATRRLLKAGANVHARTHAGQTALHLCGTVTKARWLVAHGADPNACDAGGRTPLALQTLTGRREVIEFLTPITPVLNPSAETKPNAP